MGIARVPRAYANESSQGRIKDSSIYIGFIKANNDASRNGRLSVYIPELGGDPTSEQSWITASYCSPFAGASDPSKLRAEGDGMESSQTSYGFWGIPPDLNNEVAIFFANGDSQRAFWFGCVYQQNMNHMVPGLASNIPTDPNWKDNTGTLPPVVEYNKRNVGNVDKPSRPIFTPLLKGLQKQGLTRDFERGVSSTSARREAPSKVLGLLSPRSNSIQIDDNEENEFIRMRTRSGAQILIHETTGYIYLNSRDGGSWVEIAENGVNIYSENSISIRSEDSLNFRADKNIVLDAGVGLYMKSGQDATLQTGRNLNIGVGNNLVMAAEGSVSLSAGRDGNIFTTGKMNLFSTGDMSVRSSGNIARDATKISDNSGAAASIDSTDALVPTTLHVADTVVQNGSVKSALRATIVPVLPSHEPWSGHSRRDVPRPQGQAQDSAPGYPQRDNFGNPLVPTGDGDKKAINNPTDQRCPVSVGPNSTKISDTMYNAIVSSAQKSGVDPAVALAVGDIESGGYDPRIYSNSTHDAKGAFQIQNSTWNEMVSKYGSRDGVGSGDRLDDAASAKMGVRYLSDQQATLRRAGVANPTGGMIYASYNVGAGSTAKLLAADPNARAIDIVGSSFANGNPAFYFAGGRGGTPLTVAQTFAAYDNKVNSKAVGYAALTGTPAPCSRDSPAEVAGNSASGATGATPGANGSYKASVDALGNAKGTSVGTGQCVALVQSYAGAPLTKDWAQGDQVKGNTSLASGTAIATFNSNGNYANNTDGTSHAAIYIGQDSTGIIVVDQWKGSAAAQRHISFNDAKSPSNNGNAFHVISNKGPITS